MAKKRTHRPEGYRNTQAPPVRRTAAAAPVPATPPPSSGRERFERLSTPWLLRMKALPGFVIPVALGLLLFLGLVLPWAWAGLLLIAIGLFLLWLTALSWPAVSVGSRALRMVVNVGILALGVGRLVGWT
jgi:hypothetical protein